MGPLCPRCSGVGWRVRTRADVDQIEVVVDIVRCPRCSGDGLTPKRRETVG